MATTLLPKQKGEWAEVCFAAEILRRGWRISRPYGDSSPYDCIVDASPSCHPERSAAKSRDNALAFACLALRSEALAFHFTRSHDRPSFLSRVQVKSVTKPERDPRSNHHASFSRRIQNSKLNIQNPPRFHVTVAAGRNRKLSYSAAQIDIVAVLVVPHRKWYIIPVAALCRQVSISLHPGGRFECYREAWEVLAKEIV